MKLQTILKGRSPEGSDLHSNQKPGRDDESTYSNKKTHESKATKELQGSGNPWFQRPTQFDVLFGRGKPYQGHEGNIRLHKVIDLHKARYTQARRHEKTEIAEEIVQFVKNSGAKTGRFLKRVEGDGSWAEVSDSIARDKVSHALRGKPRKVETYSKSPYVIDELSASKRPSEAGERTPEQVKRMKFANKANASELLELLEAQRRSNSMIAPPLASSAFLPCSAVALSALPNIDMFSQLLTSALADIPLFGGLRDPLLFVPMGGLSSGLPHVHALHPRILSGQSQLSPPLLQSLLSEHRSSSSNPRLWW